MRVVIVGSGIAAVAALQAMRAAGFSGKVTVVTNEAPPFYYRPMIPLLIDGSRTLAETKLTFDPLQGLDGELVSDTVTALNTEKRELSLLSERVLTYEKLLLATGSAPVLPPVAGLEGEGVFTLRTAADALAIRAYIEREMVQAAVVLGGGLAGVKAAEALRRAGLRVTLVERLPFILYPAADAAAATILSRRLKEAGVTVLTGVTAGEVTRKQGKVEAVRVGPHWIAAQLVVVATGVRPNLAFLKGSNIAYKTGILVDEHLQTNAPGIWAAGDVVEYREVLRRRSMVSGLWSNAVAMGKVAGANIAGFLKVANAMMAQGVV
mgnify:CR=1 FL=1|uniref:FAD/NAD(P)-binding domain-containing protein n=1 Tax=Ammonifex degensii TaxID=42838 RepID=A0A7C2EJ41_9THEO